MDQSFENENKIHGNERCEIYMNDVIMEEMEESFEYNPIVQTKPRKIPRNEEKIILCWIFFIVLIILCWVFFNFFIVKMILCWVFFIV
jgi:hypothetical protein